MGTEVKDETAVAKKPKAPIAIGERGLRLTTLEEAFRFAEYVIAAGLAPKGVTRPEQALIAMQAGAELGFTPMRSLAAITVINGRAGLMGEAALAKIHEVGVCSQPPIITVEGIGDDRTAKCRFQRRNMPEPVVTTFSVRDAKAAGLWGKDGPWKLYSDDMLQWRAVSRACKRYFGDVTMGLTIAEELRDYPATSEPRSLAPPSEPDPLLIAATATNVTPDVMEVDVVDEDDWGPDGSPSDEPPAIAREADELETAIRERNTIAGVSKVWRDATETLMDLAAQIPEREAELRSIYHKRLADLGAKP